MISDTKFVVEHAPNPNAPGRAFGNFVLPLSVVCAFALLADNFASLPAFLAELLVGVPYYMLGLGLILSVAFKRGRVLVTTLALIIAYAGFRFLIESGSNSLAARTIYLALCIFVPVNLAFLSFLQERGALNPYGGRRLILLLIEIGVVAAIIEGGHAAITDALYRPLVAGVDVAGSPVPQIALIVMVIAIFVTVVRAVASAASIDAALAVVIVAFAGACNDFPAGEVFVWLTATGVILIGAVVQDSYRMAFNDELTGLPGRRALDESLMGLERSYTIAMLDVDHFKAFNDTWGHDVGDQVLKLVASRLQRVGGGGKAYRYGGEEFTVVYPGKRLIEVLGHLEALRLDIEGYRLRIRRRELVQEAGRHGNPAGPAASWVSVTVSIGVAAKGARVAAPADILAAADQALYRAKSAGRNRVSR